MTKKQINKLSAKKNNTEFISLAAHQLQTPASKIKWALKTILDEDLGKITNKQKEFIREAYKNNEQIIILINDLLNVAKIEEGMYLYEPTLANLEVIIKSVLDSYKEEVKKRKLKIKFDILEEKLPLIMIDAEKIKIAFQNLLDNAVKYTMPEGKIIISIGCNNKNIEVQVQDTGVGIPTSQQKKVFSKFFRGDNIKKTKTEGTGLGLFLTKNIIEAHGGKIWFKSEENKGSTFYFNLPINK